MSTNFMKRGRIMLISVLMCALCLVSCGNSAEISSEVSVAGIVTTVTAVQTTQPTSETVTVPVTTTENINETADIEVPENAAYSKKKYYIGISEKQLTEISFFDEHDNVICNVNCNLHDNIFRTMRYVYKYNDDNTISSKKFIAENGITSTNEYEYNDDGTLKSISYFIEGGDLVKTERYEFNEDGSIRLKSKTIYTYTDGRLIKEDFYYNNRLLHYIEYEYDENGIMISDTEYDNLDNDEVHEIRTEYIYDDKGRLSAEQAYQNNHKSWRIEYEYDEQDRLIKETYYSRINSYFSYSYDENGNLSEKTVDGEFGVTVTDYTYEENNRLIKAEDYHDGELLYTYEYECEFY